MQDPQGQVPGRDGFRGGIDQINQHPGVHEEAGTPPVEFLAFVGPHELQIYLPEIDHSSPSSPNLDQLS